MKTKTPIAIIIALIASAASSALADSRIEAGPRKGRILKLTTSKAEFVVEKDRKVSIAFYDTAMKEQSPGGHVVTATAEAPGGKKKLEFEKKENLLVSKEPLPEGEHYNVVVQVKETADATPQNFRIKLNLSMCGECSNPEYACTCDH